MASLLLLSYEELKHNISYSNDKVISESSVLQTKTPQQFIWMVALVYYVPFQPVKCLLCLKHNMVKKSEINHIFTLLLQAPSPKVVCG